jgi:hypothetical protein
MCSSFCSSGRHATSMPLAASGDGQPGNAARADPSVAPAGPAAGWPALAVTFLVIVASSLANLARPAVRASFRAGFGAAELVVAAYLLAHPASLVVGGRVGGLPGRKRVLVTGVAVFTSAALACAAAPSITVRIVARHRGPGRGAALPAGAADHPRSATRVRRAPGRSACSGLLSRSGWAERAQPGARLFPAPSEPRVHSAHRMRCQPVPEPAARSRALERIADGEHDLAALAPDPRFSNILILSDRAQPVRRQILSKPAANPQRSVPSRGAQRDE